MEVSKLELKTPSIAHRDFHFPKESKDGNGEEDSVSSIYAQVLKKNSFGTHNVEMFESKEIGSDRGMIKYSIKDEGFSFLTNVNISVVLPHLEIKNEYSKLVQICYPNNLLHAIIKESNLMINDDNPPIETFNTVSSDNYLQKFMSGQEKESYTEKIGNIPELTEWNSRLPNIELTAPQLWSMFRPRGSSNKPRGSLPLFYKKNKIFFNYRFNLMLVDLLRMRIRQPVKNDADGEEFSEWKIVQPDLDFIKNISKEARLNIPELWGMFDLIQESEISFYKDHQNNGSHDMWVKQFISFKGSSTELSRKEHGENIKSIDITFFSQFACKSIHWLAQNKNSEQLNQPSNYTTNTENPLVGWSPLGNISISYLGGTEKIKEINSQKISSMHDKYFPGSASTGFCAISIAKNPDAIQSDFTIDISGRMIATLDIIDQNPYPSDKIDELTPTEKINKMIDSKPKYVTDTVSFTPYVIISVDKKISFVDGKKVEIHNELK